MHCKRPSPTVFARLASVGLILVGLGLALSSHARAWGDTAPDRFAQWTSEIEAIARAQAREPEKKGGIVFAGSSSIRLWHSLATDFPEHPVFNGGFGGSQLVDVAHFADRILVPPRPRLVVVYAGGNDIHAGVAPEQVARRFRILAEHLRQRLPDVRIVYISIAPNPARWGEVARVRQANEAIREFCQQQAHLRFLDVFGAMIGPDGLPRVELFVADRLHMNAAGYALWTRLLRPHLH